jgi:hypothetical protein
MRVRELDVIALSEGGVPMFFFFLSSISGISVVRYRFTRVLFPTLYNIVIDHSISI